MDTALWMVARGSGLSAVVLLTGAMVLGLMLSLRLRPARWPAVVTNELHRDVTSLALWMTGLHLVTLLADSRAGIHLVNLVVPFTSAADPVWNGLGVIGLAALVAVAVSTWARGRIGHRVWRRLHHLAFVAYVMAMLHGLMAGTDTGQWWALPVYVGSLVVVGGLTLRRIEASRTAASARPPQHATGPTTPTTPTRMPTTAPRSAPGATTTPGAPAPMASVAAAPRRERAPIRL